MSLLTRAIIAQLKTLEGLGYRIKNVELNPDISEAVEWERIEYPIHVNQYMAGNGTTYAVNLETHGHFKGRFLFKFIGDNYAK